MSHLRLGALAGSCLALILGCATSQAQFYKLHNADVAFSAQGQFTTPVTNNGSATLTQNNSLGALITLRDHPVPWAGIEINAGMTDFREQYHYTVVQGLNSTPTTYQTKTYETELTAGYLFHLHTPVAQPFVAIGGGAVDFLPDPRGMNQWRGTGLVDFGFDLTGKRWTGQHFGVRLQEHTLIYRAPTYNTAQFQVRSWVVQNSPSVGVFARW